VIANNTIVIAGGGAGTANYAINVGGTAQVFANSIAQFAPSHAINIQSGSVSPAMVGLADNVVQNFNSTGGDPIHVVSSCSGCATGVVSMDYDQLSAAHGTVVAWNGSYYSSLAKFTAATGQEAHGIQAPAGFADPANGNVSLTPGSPAVDSAFLGTLSTPLGSFALPATDAWGGARVDDAATPNTGAATISYADRGAYEMHNPGFETNTAGWNTSASDPGVTLTQVAGGHTGNGAALLTNTATTPATCNLNDSPNIVHTTTAGTYMGTLWVRSDNPGATLTLRLREWAGTTAVGQAKTTVALTTQWQPVTVQYTAVEPGASTLDVNAYEMKAPPGTCFYADDASVAVA
jgi:hypothetical protein